MSQQSHQVFFELKIGSENVKSICAVISLLAKAGRELIIEIDDRSDYFTTMRALNDSKSAFVSAEFEDRFFVKAELYYSPITCKVVSKSLPSIFSNMKNIIGITIRLEINPSFVVFELLMSNHITRTHKFLFQECEAVTAVFDDNSASYFQSIPRVFNNLLDHIYRSPEIIMNVSNSHITFASYHHGKFTDKTDRLSTGLCVNISDFDRFVKKVGDVEVIFSSKEV